MRYCPLCGFVVVCQLVHSQSAQAQNEPLPDGTRLTFRAPTTTEEQQFAFAQLRRHVENEEPSVWRTALSNGWIKLAEADLNDDGVPEVS